MVFGFLLFPDLEELDLVGPWEMISMWRKYAEYYPFGKIYGSFHRDPNAPEYLRKARSAEA
jgi:hypothetical protein